MCATLFSTTSLYLNVKFYEMTNYVLEKHKGICQPTKFYLQIAKQLNISKMEGMTNGFNYVGYRVRSL